MQRASSVFWAEAMALEHLTIATRGQAVHAARFGVEACGMGAVQPVAEAARRDPDDTWQFAASAEDGGMPSAGVVY